MDIDVGINDVGELRKPIELPAFQTTARSGAMRTVYRVQHRPIVSVAALVSKLHEHYRRSRRVKLTEPELVAHHLSSIETVLFKNAGFMIASTDREHLPGRSYFAEELHTLVQLFHRLQRCLIHSSPDTCAGGCVHKVTVEDGKTIIGILDISQPLKDLVAIAVQISDVKIRERQDLKLLEISEPVFDNFHTLTQKQRADGERRKPSALLRFFHDSMITHLIGSFVGILSENYISTSPSLRAISTSMLLSR